MKRSMVFGPLFVTLVVTGFILRLSFLGRVPPTLYLDEIDDYINSQNWFYYGGIFNFSFTGLRISLFEILSGNALAVILLNFNLNIAARFSVFLYSLLICLPLYNFSIELYMNKTIARLSTLLWLFSPLSFFMGLYGTSLELFPLFYFIIFVTILLRLHKQSYKLNRNWFYLIFISAVLIIIRDNLVWSFLDFLFIVLMLIIYETFSRSGLIRQKFNSKQQIIFLSSLVVSLILSWIFLIRKLSAYLLSSSLNLVLLPFPRAITLFFVRLYYFIAPNNLILLNPFPSLSLQYLPGFTPMFFLSEGFIVFPAIAYSIICLYKKKFFYQNLVLLSLVVGGYLAPVLSLANPPNFALESETIFAFPPLTILISVFIVHLKHSTETRVTVNFKGVFLHYKQFIMAIITCLIVLMLVNISGFYVDLSRNYDNSVISESNSNFYPFYGLEQSSNYIVLHNLTSYPLYYYPNTTLTSSWINLSTSESLSFWFYNEGYPLDYLKEYSDGKINSIKLLQPNSYPVVGIKGVIILNQNVSFDTILRNSGYLFNILSEILRPNGEIAWQIIKLTPNITAGIKVYNNSFLMNNSMKTNFTLNNFNLTSSTSNFSFGLKMKVLNAHLNSQKLEPLIRDPLFLSIGIACGTNFQWLPQSIQNGTVAYFEIKSSNSSYILYAVPPIDISSNETYFLFLSFRNDTFYFYENNSLLETKGSNYKFTWSQVIYLASSCNARLIGLFYQGYISPGVEDSLYYSESYA